MLNNNDGATTNRESKVSTGITSFDHGSIRTTSTKMISPPVKLINDDLVRPISVKQPLKPLLNDSCNDNLPCEEVTVSKRSPIDKQLKNKRTEQTKFLNDSIEDFIENESVTVRRNNPNIQKTFVAPYNNESFTRISSAKSILSNSYDNIDNESVTIKRSNKYVYSIDKNSIEVPEEIITIEPKASITAVNLDF